MSYAIGASNSDLKISSSGDIKLNPDAKVEIPAGKNIVFESDTNLYRSASNTLKTDDSFVVGSNLTVFGNLSGDNNIVKVTKTIDITNTANETVTDCLILHNNGSGNGMGVRQRFSKNNYDFLRIEAGYNINEYGGYTADFTALSDESYIGSIRLRTGYPATVVFTAKHDGDIDIANNLIVGGDFTVHGTLSGDNNIVKVSKTIDITNTANVTVTDCLILHNNGSGNGMGVRQRFSKNNYDFLRIEAGYNINEYGGYTADFTALSDESYVGSIRLRTGYPADVVFEAKTNGDIDIANSLIVGDDVSAGGNISTNGTLSVSGNMTTYGDIYVEGTKKITLDEPYNNVYIKKEDINSVGCIAFYTQGTRRGYVGPNGFVNG